MISEVKVGDVVLSANAQGHAKYSTVVAVPHEKNLYRSEFVELFTKAGKEVKLTVDHMIMSGSCTGAGKHLPLTRAGDVVKGSCVSTVDGLDEVISASIVRGLGVYTFVTMEEYVVVNGVIASPFAHNHAVVHSIYNIHRWLYRLFPSLLESSWAKQTNELFGEIVAAVSY